MTVNLPLEKWKDIESLVNQGLLVELLESRFVVWIKEGTTASARLAAQQVEARWVGPPALEVQDERMVVPELLADINFAVVSASPSGFQLRKLARADQALFNAILNPEVPTEVTIRRSKHRFPDGLKTLKSLARPNLVVRVEDEP